jgi:hypothetical protein
VHLYIPDHTLAIAPQLQNSMPEIRSCRQIPFTRIDYRHNAAANRPELGRSQGGIVPDRLHMALRNWSAI